MTALGLGAVTLSTAAPAAAAAGSWPTTWTAYTSGGVAISDHSYDMNPESADLSSGSCGNDRSSCMGAFPSVYYASDGTNAFFRFRTSIDNNDASFGGYRGSAFLVNLYDTSNTLKVVVGVDGTDGTSDYVYVTTPDGTSTSAVTKVYSYPWTGSNVGSRLIPAGDGSTHFFLDFQVPVAAIATIWPGFSAGTPFKMYYGTSQAAQLATINKDFMISTDTAITVTSLNSLPVIKNHEPVVTFDSQQGSAVASQTLGGATATANEPSPNPSRAGYAFNGWFDAATGGSRWNFATAITADKTLYAQWSPGYAVTFDAQGGTPAPDGQTVTSGGLVAAPTAPTRTGHTFAGWWTTPSTGGTQWSFGSSTVAGATALYARWTANTYAVSFDTNGGSANPANQTVSHGGLVSAPTPPTRAGHSFGGWFTSASGGAQWDFGSSTVTSATSLVARWAITSYPVAFSTGAGASSVSDQSIAHGSSATAPTDPTRAGYAFAGWYDAASGGSAWDFATPITDATTLYARWTQAASYTVGFNVHGGSPAPGDQIVASGATVSVPVAPTLTGHSFEGWYDAASGGSAWDFATPITVGRTLHARWTALNYPVAFATGTGASPVTDQNIPYGSPAIVPTTDPTRTGYAFAGWYDAATGGSAWDFTTPITGATTIHAHWTTGNQTVVFDQPTATTIGDTFTPGPTATSGLPVTLTSQTPAVCTVSTGVVVLIAEGTCTLEANQPGGGVWLPAATVTHSFQVLRKSQTITFGHIVDIGVGDPLTVSPSSSSGLAVTLTSLTPDVCTVDAAGVVATSIAGVCTIAASQGGTGTWASATTVTRSFAVGRLSQAINFGSIGNQRVGDAVPLAATAGSGLPVGFSSLTPITCSVTGTTVTTLAAGTCTVAANQSGDTTWAPALQVTQSFAVGLVAQTITVAQPAVLEAESSYDLVPSASSGLAVVVTTTTPAVCTVSGGVVTAHAPGLCTLVASQGGNGTYAPAADVTITFTVTALPLREQTIAFSAPEILLSGAGAVSLTATASSQLPVSLTLVSGDCGLSGGSLTAPEDTTCTVSATQAGDRRWSPAPPVSVQIQFVSPVDDSFSMPSPITAAKGMDVRMLANDPAGLALEGAGRPNHGSLTAGGDTWLTYTPQEEFHGVDEFSYTVSDVLGRTDQAMVRVDVANADPVVSGGTVEQLAGTMATVAIDVSDPNGDVVTLSTRSERHVDSSTGGRKVRVSPDETVSGWTVVKVRASDDFGGSAVAEVRSLVTPLPVARAERRLVDGGTAVSWPRAATAQARYKILVDGKVACVTVETSCTIDRILGPDFAVQVQVLGLDGTSSTLVRADARGHRQVLLRTVYFESGSAVLARTQMRKLTSVAALIRRVGFHDAHVSGYTDSDGGAAYNLALSKDRTQMVASYLRRTRQIDSAQAWFGYNDPVASNASVAGKSLNRRVEIRVSY